MQIETLIKDIYSLVQRKDGWFDESISSSLGGEISLRLREQLGENRRQPSLRLSQMGPRCPKALWYSINKPELRETLPPWVEIKYSYGHVIEALAIALARGAGHRVTGEQDELILDGIVGHRDCVIDGYTVDVKSASTISFNKFKSGSFNDTFGYLDQLDGYVLASADDPLVTHKNKAFLLVIDKTLGHLCLYPHEVTDERSKAIRERIVEYKSTIRKADPPACTCGVIPQGASGNLQLDVKASYSPYKHCCFPNLRTFIYNSGPVYLTRVVRKPDVLEVDRDKKIIYNGGLDESQSTQRDGTFKQDISRMETKQRSEVEGSQSQIYSSF